MPHPTIKALETDLATARALVDSYRERYHARLTSEGEKYAEALVRQNAVKAATDLAQANAKLTYALSRVIEMAVNPLS